MAGQCFHLCSFKPEKTRKKYFMKKINFVLTRFCTHENGSLFDQQVTNCRGGFTFVVKSLNNKFLTVNITNFVKFRVFYVTFNHLLVHLLVGYS